MNVLVTGAAGFIGSHVTEALLARGDTVVGLDNFNPYYEPARKRANVALSRSNPRFTLHEADVRDSESVERICVEGRFDVVVHLAAMVGVRYSVKRPHLFSSVNLGGTVKLLEVVRKASIPHFVFASTSSVYGRSGLIPFREDDPLGRPLAPYPATKIAGEVMGHAYHNLFDLSFTAVRLFSVYGPRGRPDMIPYHATDCIAHDRKFDLYEGGKLYRDWTYISDVVAGIVAAIDRPLGYEVINLGRGEPVQTTDLVDQIEKLMGRPARVAVPPAPASEPPITYADIAKARDLLSYTPTVSIAAGLSRFWEWYQAEILKSL